MYIVVGAALFFLFSGQAAAGLININTATQQQLDQLPNIGPARARAIISYREESGPFKRKEDIMNVHGIGKGIFEGMKDLITCGAGVEARGKAADEEPPPLPAPRMYAGKKYVPRTCWSCKNSFHVPEDLKEGWCPFCGKKWSIR